jgi:hypothetical protein
MPVAKYGTFFHYLRCMSLEPDENFSDSQEADRHQRVCCDAQRAMIGVADGRMPNGRMCNRHEQEQDQAHPKREAQPIQLQASIDSEVCRACSQGILLGEAVP